MLESPENIGKRSELKEASNATKRLLLTLQCDAFRVVVRILRTYFVERRGTLNTAIHRVVRSTRSVYVTNCSALIVEAQMHDEFVKFDDEGWRFVQRAVTAESTYSSSKTK